MARCLLNTCLRSQYPQQTFSWSGCSFLLPGVSEVSRCTKGPTRSSHDTALASQVQNKTPSLIIGLCFPSHGAPNTRGSSVESITFTQPAPRGHMSRAKTSNGSERVRIGTLMQVKLRSIKFPVVPESIKDTISFVVESQLTPPGSTVLDDSSG